MEQPGLEPVPIWDSGTASGSFTYYTTALAPFPNILSVYCAAFAAVTFVAASLNVQELREQYWMIDAKTRILV